jgi:hypothetical protein
LGKDSRSSWIVLHDCSDSFWCSDHFIFCNQKNAGFFAWLKTTLFVLFLDLVLLDIVGLVVYAPYRASGGPRTFLKASASTAWLHTIIFEHKEFLAFGPPLIILSALLVTRILGPKFNNTNNSNLRRSIFFGIIASLVIVLVVAFEAVLVSKTAPLK